MRFVCNFFISFQFLSEIQGTAYCLELEDELRFLVNGDGGSDGEREGARSAAQGARAGLQ